MTLFSDKLFEKQGQSTNQNHPLNGWFEQALYGPITCGSPLKGALYGLAITLLPRAAPYSGAFFFALFYRLTRERVRILFEAELIICFNMLLDKLLDKLVDEELDEASLDALCEHVKEIYFDRLLDKILDKVVDEELMGEDDGLMDKGGDRP